MRGSVDSGIDWSNSVRTKSFIKKLKSNQDFRHKHQLFFIEGVRNFIQAVNHNFELAVIYYSERLLISPIARQTLRRLRRSGTRCINVSPEAFREVSTMKRASGIGAIAAIKHTSLHKTSLRSGLCWIVLDKVRSEGNFGTLVRTSEAIGGAGFILLNKDIDPYSPNVIRATMGSVFNQKIIYTSMSQFRNWLDRHKCQLIGASIDGKKNFQDFNYPATPLLFLGEERKGLTKDQQNICRHLIRIPMVGEADSLNVGVAGSLLMYEIFRRNRLKSK